MFRKLFIVEKFCCRGDLEKGGHLVARHNLLGSFAVLISSAFSMIGSFVDGRELIFEEFKTFELGWFRYFSAAIKGFFVHDFCCPCGLWNVRFKVYV